MVNLLCMVKDVSYSEEDVTFILTSTIGNNLASKKKKYQIGFISTYYLTSLFHVCTTLVVLAMFKVKFDSQRVI